MGRQLQRQVGISGYEAARIFAKPKKTRKKQLLSSSLLYVLVAFRNSKKQLSQLEEEKFKSSCQFYGSIFFGKKKKVRDFILAQRTEGEGSIFFNNVGSAREHLYKNSILLCITSIFSNH